MWKQTTLKGRPKIKILMLHPRKINPKLISWYFWPHFAFTRVVRLITDCVCQGDEIVTLSVTSTSCSCKRWQNISLAWEVVYHYYQLILWQTRSLDGEINRVILAWPALYIARNIATVYRNTKRERKTALPGKFLANLHCVSFNCQKMLFPRREFYQRWEMIGGTLKKMQGTPRFPISFPDSINERSEDLFGWFSNTV